MNKNILLVSHDAGGAAIVSSWARLNPMNRYHFCLEGPAIHLFQSKLAPFRNESRDILKESLEEFDLILTGTSWESDLEKMAIQAAKRRSIFSASFLDHWVNYRERFLVGGKQVLPNEIWTGDSYAFAMANEIFGEASSIVFEKNPYWTEILNEMKNHETRKNQDKGERLNILYVTEPTSLAAEKATGSSRGYGYTEFEALDKYMLMLTVQPKIVDELRLRLHPREPAGKYDELISKYRNKIKISVSTNLDLALDCAWCDWVVGCDSMAMAVGVLAKREVFCCIPPDGRRSALPFREIQNVYEQEGTA